MGFAKNIPALLVGRIVSGFAVGFMAVPSQVSDISNVLCRFNLINLRSTGFHMYLFFFFLFFVNYITYIANVARVITR